MPIDPVSPLGKLVEGLGALSNKELNEVLNHMSPAPFGVFQWVNLDNNSLIAQALNNHLIQLNCSKRDCKKKGIDNAFYMEGYGNFVDSNTQQNLRGYDAYTGGVLGGFDHCWSHFHIGVGFAYDYTDFMWENFGGDALINSYKGFIYGSYYSDSGEMDVVLIGGGNDYKVARRIRFDVIGIGVEDVTANSNHWGGLFTAHAKGKLKASIGAFKVEPYGSLDYHYLYEQDFKEKDSPINLRMNTHISNMMRTELGVNFMQTFKVFTGCIAPFVSLSWVRKFSLSRGVISGSSFCNNGCCKMCARTFNGIRDFISPRVGIKVTNTKGISCLLSYSGEFNNKNTIHQAEVLFEWVY